MPENKIIFKKLKPTLRIDEQLNLLKNRNLKLNLSNEELENFFIENNYDTVVNGYSAPFFVNYERDKYFKGATIKQIISFYNFDKKLLQILHKYILKIERCFKQILIYSFLIKIKNNKNIDKDIFENGLFLEDLFEEKKFKENDYLWEEFKKVFPIYSPDKDITKTKSQAFDFLLSLFPKEKEVKAELKYKKYSSAFNIPLWRLSQSWNFGTALYFYKNIDLDTQRKVRAHYNTNDNFVLDKFVLYNLMDVIRVLRNKISHDNEIFSFNKKIHIPLLKIFEETYFSKISISKFLDIKKEKNKSSFEKRKTYFSHSLIIILFLLIDKKDVENLESEIKESLVNLKNELSNNIFFEKILEMMNFKKSILFK